MLAEIRLYSCALFKKSVVASTLCAMMRFVKMTPLTSLRDAVSRERLSAASSPEKPHPQMAVKPLGKRRGWLCEAVGTIHTLHLYGAVGIVAFGWALSRMLGFSCAPFAPLWFCGALLVYNLDRLKHDPSDALNTPGRLRRHNELRTTSIALAMTSALMLIVLPVSRGQWLLLFLTLAAAVFSLSYSFPIFGFRFKDVPAVKTLFAPAVVLTAFLLPVLLSGELPPDRRTLSAAAWSGCLLLFNMTLCDLRDLAGDRAHGTRSIPVLLGENGTRVLLVLLLALQLFIALASGWSIAGCASAVYLGALLFALRKPQPESFYEWFVEGILFLPAAAELWKHFAHGLPI
jgi:4-hydroxybenzoate polyprenyltransferase